MGNTAEHWKLAASYFNIAAAGTFVAAVATVPLAIFSAHLDSATAAQLIGAFVLGSLFLHGVGQITLRQVTT